LRRQEASFSSKQDNNKKELVGYDILLATREKETEKLVLVAIPRRDSTASGEGTNRKRMTAQKEMQRKD